MEYQKIINLLDNTPKQLTKNWFKTNYDSQGGRNKNNQIRFKTLMLRSSLCDYSDTCIHVEGTVTVAKVTDAAPSNANKKVIFKNCVSFTSCIRRTNNTQVDDAQCIDAVISIYYLIEYTKNYSKSIWNFVTIL